MSTASPQPEDAIAGTAAVPTAASARATTPAMAQFAASKQQHPDALLFFRMGDFYELFFEDAKVAARALGLALTSRSKGEGAIPMAGVPVRAVAGYLKRLVQQGFKVAICEQLQDPKEAKGLVERAVVRVVTAGTLTEDDLLDGKKANRLVAVAPAAGRAGLAWVDLSTGEFLVHECAAERLADELSRLEPAEVLLADALRSADRPWLAQNSGAANGGGPPVTFRAACDFGHDTAARALQQFFRTATLEGFGLQGLPMAVGAAGALIAYLLETQRCALPHLRPPAPWHDGAHMRLDRATLASLELTATLRGEGEGTPLLAVLDRTKTAMGARLLRARLTAPLRDLAAIRSRQEAVAELHGDAALLAAVTDGLARVLDLERLGARVATGRANGRDLGALRASLEQLPAVRERVRRCRAPALQDLAERLDPLPDAAAAIAACLVDEPPLALKEGGLVRQGFSSELDELRLLARDSTEWMARYQRQLAERTGIPSLKVGFNRVFGYFIEVTHTHRAVELPKEFQRKQTTKNAERYVTDELRTFETKILSAEEDARELEFELFQALRAQLAESTAALQRTAAATAELDVHTALAAVARDRSWCRPEVDDSLALRIDDGRHPVLEATHAPGTFVPNDTDLEPPHRRLVLLTGPNMAGKSTWIRQNALLVVLAQIGAFVPARAARIGVVDRVFTRVGAADDIARGASTFMVEMTETANILNHATARSLVILDEVGRGTSTHDGLALAWAIAEDLHDRVGCRALFATHYHQLADLAGPGKGYVNQRVAVREWGDEIVFLHRIEPGGTDKSYGLHVARLAGVPPTVLSRARAVLAELEAEGGSMREALVAARDRAADGPRQRELFQAPPHPLLAELRALDVDGLTPRQALELLARWKEQA